jgi:predicted transglutaminase-like cysteine proteinase
MRRVPLLLALLLSPLPAIAAPPPVVPTGALADAPEGYMEMCQREASLCTAMAGGEKIDGTVATLATPGDFAITPTGATVSNGVTAGQGTQCGIATAPVAPAFALRPAVAMIDPLVEMPRQAVVACADPVASRPAPLPAVATNDRTAKQQAKALRRLLVAVNVDVNRHVRQVEDFELYGVAERWERAGSLAHPAGDCEDLAIEKRMRLIEAGVPAQDLALAVVYGHRIGLHTVLVARLSGADYVLDNLTSRFVRWNQTDYHWLRIQSRDDFRNWYRIDA